MLLTMIAIILSWVSLVVAQSAYPVLNNAGIDASYPASGANISPSQTPNFTFQELYDLQVNFLEHFISPLNAKEAKSVNSTLLAEDCRGRVDVTRTFVGRELNTEYLFGLFANLADNPSEFSLLGLPVKYEILHFAANQNIASASTKFMFNFPALKIILPLRIDTWNTFNAKKEISQYDATFVWWDWAFATLLEAAAPALGAKSQMETLQKLTGKLAQSICKTASDFCTGDNKQYESEQECQGYLTKQVRFGAPYELGRNTLTCRMVHQNMVPVRPSVHCAHLGKTGGGYCTDNTNYTGTVNANFFTNAPFIPYGKGNSSTASSGSTTGLEES